MVWRFLVDLVYLAITKLFTTLYPAALQHQSQSRMSNSGVAGSTDRQAAKMVTIYGAIDMGMRNGSKIDTYSLG